MADLFPEFNKLLYRERIEGSKSIFEPDFQIVDPESLTPGLINSDTLVGNINVRRGSITGAKFQTNSDTGKGIKLFSHVPNTVTGNTDVFLPTANAEPASPFNGAEWINPSNAQLVDGNYATASQGASQRFSIWKSFTNLQADIPSGVTITGISVRCFASVDTIAELNDNGRRLLFQLSKDGSVVVGINQISDATLTATDAFVSGGGSEDLWGTTWSRSDFTSNFGIMITGNGASSPTATVFQIDYIQITVHYERDFTEEGETIADSFFQFWNKIGNTLLYLKRNTLNLFIDAANLVIKGTLTVEPQEVVIGNTSTNFPTANAEPESPFDGRLWTNPANAEVNDGVYAVDTQNGGQRWQIWNGFGLSIPDGATITGIIVDIEAKVDSGTAKIVAQLTKDGSAVIGTNKTTADFTTSDSVKTVGDSSDLWGTTWTVGDFGADFGVMLTGNTSPKTYSVDFINITVHYTTTGENNIDGDIISTVDDTYALGSSSKRFTNLHTREANIDVLNAPLSKLKIATTDVDLANTVTQIELATVIIPANTLGTNNGVYFRANFDTFVNGGNVSHGLTLILEYGTTELSLGSIELDGSTVMVGYIEGYILASGATNTQELWIQLNATEDQKTGPATIAQTLSPNAVGSATEDSTTALIGRLIGNWSNANVSNTMQVRNSIIQIIK